METVKLSLRVGTNLEVEDIVELKKVRKKSILKYFEHMTVTWNRCQTEIQNIQRKRIVAGKKSMGMVSMEDTLGEDGTSLTLLVRLINILIKKIDSRSEKSFDIKFESSNGRQRNDTPEIESTNTRTGFLDSMNDKDIKACDGEERGADLEKSSKGKTERLEEDTKGSLTRKERSRKERLEGHISQKSRSR